jgi:tetratricopeptide (TPR) repeat protein
MGPVDWIMRRVLSSRAIPVIFAALTLVCLPGQSEEPSPVAEVVGHVFDSHHIPAANAKVCLQQTRDDEPRTVQSDQNGAFHFSSVRRGSYTLKAQLASGEETAAVSLDLTHEQEKNVELRVPERTTTNAASRDSAPQYFDEPQFKVAGVTDASSLGGHGSDAVTRTKESLAKDVIGFDSKFHQPTTMPPASSEKSLRESLLNSPNSPETNGALGSLLLESGRAREAIPFLERASLLAPGDFELSFAVAKAYTDAGKLDQAHDKIGDLLTHHDRSELHHLLGDVMEKQGHALEAVRAYQRAAELSPTEANLFDWGSELLLHRASEPAIEVFSRGNHLYPKSVRMLTALGVAWYARGSYDQAVQHLCAASDLDPSATGPYLFMGKIYTTEKARPEAIEQRLERFAKLQPENPFANYYYALALHRRAAGSEAAENVARAETLLLRAIQLDPALAIAHVQLGILYAERKDFAKAVHSYQAAIAAAPKLAEAHYRLGQIYMLTGKKAQGRSELELYRQLAKADAEEAERDRRQIRQFVYTLKDQPAESKPQP